VVVSKNNRVIAEWANYFSVGATSKMYRAIDSYTVVRLRRSLSASTEKPARARTYLPQHLYEQYGLLRLTQLDPRAPGERRVALSESRVEGDPHVRFDEQGGWKRAV
jgi:hypothetical protein